ncbi:MAG TPA: hypothetical protein VMW42_07995 [Desulfatiglandales bacterium]|nr:hypothetical protein [Desulfatiglandales bacterium]
MKNLTTAIFGKASPSTFLTYINGRLYKGRAPAGAEYPYAVYSLITDVPEKTFSEDYENVIIQFSLFSITSSTLEVETMLTYLKALYDECAFNITDATLIWMKRDNVVFQVEEHTTPTGTNQVWAYHVDYTILESLD